MKQIVKFMFLMFVVVAVSTPAQDEKDSGLATAAYNKALSSYLTHSHSDNDFQDPIFQSFGYFNNPEIQKLEEEVERLAHVYQYDRYGKSGFSSDKYQSLTSEEKKSLKSMFGYYSLAIDSYSGKNLGVKSTYKEKSSDTRIEEFFDKYVVPYLNNDKEKTINKQKLLDEIKKRLNNLFEMKEAEKQKEVTKLEQQLKNLQSTLAERKKNKAQIIDQRINELIGLPNTLRW
jgi:hypothetical protein